MITSTSLSHPRVLWDIEAAMWRAIEESNKSDEGLGSVYLWNRDGSHYLKVEHNRGQASAFKFTHFEGDVTPHVLKALRASAGGRVHVMRCRVRWH